MFHTFAFCCLCCCCQFGVFAGTDAVKSVSVMEGDSVSLNSSLTEIQEDEEIIWTFGSNGSLLAITDGVKNIIPDDIDERFRGRLELDKKTGSLTIMNITTEHAGVYTVEISGRNSSSTYRFNVTVYEGHAPCCDSVEAVLRLVATALMGVASLVAVVLLVNEVRASRGKTEKTEEIS
ncbi:hypothetical protein R3I93_016871 [Phoxinus phoxinus]|uniref:Immunoglobulin domain-containing protein n=1 Tax=Phoxinus phoxinus TaxID=58324 RepID=A0AAN9CMC3_9TELE